MSIQIYFSNQVRALGDQLGINLLNERQSRKDPFWAPSVIVPNPNLKKWLQLHIADQQDVVANVEFEFLEEGLWKLISQVLLTDPNGGRNPIKIKPLTQQWLQWMILEVFLNLGPDDPAMKPFSDYLGVEGDTRDKDYSRRCWQLSKKLSELFLAYQNHRQEMVDEWVSDSFDLQNVSQDADEIVSSQATLYRRLFMENGKRDRQLPNYFTLAQLADFIRDLKASAKAPLRPLHLFGLSQISPFHCRLIYDLGEHYQVRLYLFNVCEEYWEDVTTPREDRYARVKGLEVMTNEVASTEKAIENGLLKLWGKPGREMLKLVSDLELQSAGTRLFGDDWVSIPGAFEAQKASILGAVQGRILGRTDLGLRLPQDTSIQILGCPSKFREMETVVNSIISNMRTDNELKLTDIAVLVPDMEGYKTEIHSAFQRVKHRIGRPGRPHNAEEEVNDYLEKIPYNLSDSMAAEESIYGNALLLLLQLSQGTFTRKAVFDLILNPCFLSRADLTREEAIIWTQWVHELGVFHHVDEEHKKADGCFESPIFSWLHGLRRLRLGRIMQTGTPPQFTSGLQEWGSLIPFSISDSDGLELLEKFSSILESLFNQILPLSKMLLPWGEWVDLIHGLQSEFLEIPADRSEEVQVRNLMVEGLEDSRLFNQTRSEQGIEKIGLPLVLSFLQNTLANLPCRRGSYLSGGVNISSLRPMRPVPHKIVYIVGMGEGHFPGVQDKSTLDIRLRNWRIGDFSTSDSNRYLFLETLMSTQDKLYLTYVDRDLQKDQEFQACSVVNELVSYLEQNVLMQRNCEGDGDSDKGNLTDRTSRQIAYEEAKNDSIPLNSSSKKYDLSNEVDFKIVHVPLEGSSTEYLHSPAHSKGSNLSFTDVLENYSDLDRLLSLVEDQEVDNPKIPPIVNKGDQGRSFEGWRNKFDRKWSSMGRNASEITKVEETEISVRISEMKKFLENPVEAIIRRNLGLYQDDTGLDLQEDEPFFSGFPLNYNFLPEMITQVLRENRDPNGLLKSIKLDQESPFIPDFYSSLTKQGLVPEGAFGKIECENLKHQFDELMGEGGTVGKFLKGLTGQRIFHNVTIGEHDGREKSDLQFPAVEFEIEEAETSENRKNPTLEIRGSLPWLWQNPAFGDLETLVITNSRSTKNPSKHVIEAFLFFLSLRASEISSWDSQEVLVETKDKTFKIHTIYKDRIRSWAYKLPSPLCSMDYLAMLTREFLISPEYDHLPFAVFTQGRVSINLDGEKIQPHTSLNDVSTHFKQQYAELLRESFEDETLMASYRPMGLLEILNVNVPDDAWDKIQRRVGPLFRFLEGK